MANKFKQKDVVRLKDKDCGGRALKVLGYTQDGMVSVTGASGEDDYDGTVFEDELEFVPQSRRGRGGSQ